MNRLTRVIELAKTRGEKLLVAYLTGGVPDIAGTLDYFKAIENGGADIIEIGVIYQNEKRAILLNSLDVIATGDALLNEQTLVDTYRGIDLFSFSNPVLFAKTFIPLVTYNNANLYCIIDNFLHI